MVDKLDRLQKIVDILKDKKIITIKELAKQFSVSEMTIRRDVSLLKEKNIINVFYGGVSLNTENDYSKMKNYISGYLIENESAEKMEEKQRIVKKAASLIQPNDVIFLDSGSTTALVADYMLEDNEYVVYCYSLNVINKVCSKTNLSVVSCGGYFHRGLDVFESEDGEALIRKTRINKAFMAARGITRNLGVTNAESYEVKMKRAAMEVAEEKILLVDSSKMGKSWYLKYAELDEFDVVITDDNIEDKYKKLIIDKGIKLYIV